MAFCENCGEELHEGSKFCGVCGKPIPDKKNENRKIVYDGKIHKCPNCGEILDAFVTECPTCKYEIRGSETSDTVKAFSEKLDKATYVRQKESVIRNFPVPNTKEDIFEFMILAASNIDENRSKTLFNAWIAKFEQCYQKASVSFSQESDFDRIQEIYDKTKKKIRRIRRKEPLKQWGVTALPFVFLILFGLIFFIPNPKAEEKEVARLENIVSEVENAIANEEFDLAMMHAKSIEYSAFRRNDELERQWNIKRDYLIKKVISEAAKKGIAMEYPSETAVEKNQQLELSGEEGGYDIDKIFAEFLDNEEKDSSVESSSSEVKSLDNSTSEIDIVDDVSKEERVESEAELEDIDSNEDTTVEDIEEAYTILPVKNFVFSLPDYWEEEGSKNEYLQYYVEKGEKTTMLSICYPEETDDEYDVSFDGLSVDNENMKKAIASVFDEGDVVSDQVFESDYGVKGMLYHFTGYKRIGWFQSVDANGYCFCFPSEKDRRWFYVYYVQTNKVTDKQYKEDYMTLISTIKENEIK